MGTGLKHTDLTLPAPDNSRGVKPPQALLSTCYSRSEPEARSAVRV